AEKPEEVETRARIRELRNVGRGRRPPTMREGDLLNADGRNGRSGGHGLRRCYVTCCPPEASSAWLDRTARESSRGHGRPVRADPTLVALRGPQGEPRPCADAPWRRWDPAEPARPALVPSGSRSSAAAAQSRVPVAPTDRLPVRLPRRTGRGH